jgi:hypothetical protein
MTKSGSFFSLEILINSPNNVMDSLIFPLHELGRYHKKCCLVEGGVELLIFSEYRYNISTGSARKTKDPF